MPEIYKDLFYILKSRRAFKASGIVRFNDNHIPTTVEIGPEINSMDLEGEIVTDILINNPIQEYFSERDALSNRNLRTQIPIHVLSEGIDVFIN